MTMDMKIFLRRSNSDGSNRHCLLVVYTMKTFSIRLRVRAITAAVWTAWPGVVVLENVGLVDSFLVLNHHTNIIHQQQRLSQPTSSPLFLKRPSSTTSSSSSTTVVTTTQQKFPCLEWKVYVDQSEASLDKGGSATLDAFLGLAPAATVQVKAALLPMGSYYASSSSSSSSSSSPNSGSSSGSSSGGNSNTNNSNNNSVGPFVRCIPLRREKSNVENNDNDDDGTDSRRAFDACNVDSVDKVYRILTKHMRVQVSAGIYIYIHA
jgi:hypothetical protein